VTAANRSPMTHWQRRDFVKALLASLPVLAIDWAILPRKSSAQSSGDTWDAVVIGSGLGGLTCAAALARQGLRPLVLEQHDRAGGYATTFRRPGGFEFDVSLHSTSVPARDGTYNLIPGFPEITDVEFVAHPSLYRAIFPEHDITVPNRDAAQYAATLKASFPAEATGIDALLAEMRGIAGDIGRLSAAQGEVDYSRFPADFPHLFGAYNRTWGQIVDAHLTDPKLRGIVSVLWGYYGLPPSKLASIYYALPTIGYLEQGGFYPRGKSQAISNSLVRFIEARGGKVALKTKVAKILLTDGVARGVATVDGAVHSAKVVVSNANAHDTFHSLIEKPGLLTEYLARLDAMKVSLSSFQVFLGLNKDLVNEAGLRDAEIFCESTYDPEAAFLASVAGESVGSGFAVTLYDNIYAGYSPAGKNTVTITILQGYDRWEKYAPDYFAGRKDAYRAEKERVADILIDRTEERLLPGLRAAIEVKEVATPLTNVRYTCNYRGGIYGWDQTLDNAMPRRLPQTTPVKGLYLASAWTQPGGGYGGVMGSGLQCFGEIMKRWE
jgi:all-trans-retinol 13,14-reductase